MPYVAGKSIEVMRGGKAVRLKPGELVPEAATWKNLKAELAWGRVKEVHDSEVKSPQPKVEKKIEKKAEKKTGLIAKPLEPETTPAKKRRGRPRRLGED